ncbi:hypothetical protein LCGC14_2903950 [marine sediment metagenome]|uniref:Uncharacterized protein n=1 Tax=marine sediment metagenome TaxID=412755 RepID=A0A0F9A1D9_9ZZZZ
MANHKFTSHWDAFDHVGIEYGPNDKYEHLIWSQAVCDWCEAKTDKVDGQAYIDDIPHTPHCPVPDGLNYRWSCE